MSDTTAVIISIGTELTQGSIGDIHGKYISGILHFCGIKVKQILQIPDNKIVFIEELKRFSDICNILIITGGLGPTSDDLTREAVAEAFGIKLIFHDELWKELKKRFSRKISDVNKKQAYIPEGFFSINNSVGTAPGFYGRCKTFLIALPGPPSELTVMFQKEVVSLVKKEFNIIPEDTLTCTSFLIPESNLEECFLKLRADDLQWSTRAEKLRIVFTLRGGSAEKREDFFNKIRGKYGHACVRRGEVSAHELLVNELKKAGITLVLAESCTGGFIAKLITDIPGSSRVLWGSIVTYTDDAKIKLLGINQEQIKNNGVVSKNIVNAMVKGALKISGADIALAISGFAGPEKSTEKPPVGTIWIAVKGKNERESSIKLQFSGSRERIRDRAAIAAVLFAEDYIKRNKDLTLEESGNIFKGSQ